MKNRKDAGHDDVVDIADGQVQQWSWRRPGRLGKLRVAGDHGVDSADPASSGEAGTRHTRAAWQWRRSHATTAWGPSPSYSTSSPT
ncbi:MAG: hypothetical protein H0V05_14565 [Euzebyaceae bacterium]|nr:hypothetical protein [Euzebyaceae bacterium]